MLELTLILHKCEGGRVFGVDAVLRILKDRATRHMLVPLQKSQGVKWGQLMMEDRGLLWRGAQPLEG